MQNLNFVTFGQRTVKPPMLTDGLLCHVKAQFEKVGNAEKLVSGPPRHRDSHRIGWELFWCEAVKSLGSTSHQMRIQKHGWEQERHMLLVI